MKVFFVPIEPFEQRYSEQWLRWFEREFDNYNVNYQTILPEDRMSDTIREGEFLDVVGTNHFKAQQLQMLCELIDTRSIRNGDVILVEDYWFPGIEMLGYVRDALGINFKIAGMFHAGTWDQNDFISRKGMRRWAGKIECGWIELADVIFVATEYHKDLICQQQMLTVNASKIKVTGFPIYPDDLVDSKLIDFEEKQNQIIFPHRFAPEKRSEIWKEMQKIIGMKSSYASLDKWRFVDTSTCPSKNHYYEMLKESKIVLSMALQETWGIAMQEGVFLGCYPFVPNTLAYKELYPSLFRYTDHGIEMNATHFLDDLSNFVVKLEEREDVFKEKLAKLQLSLTIKGSSAIPKMIDEMIKL